MSKQLESLLLRANLLTERELQKSVEKARKEAISLWDLITKERSVPEEALAEAFAKHQKLPRVKIASAMVEPETLKRLSDKLARKHQCLPLKVEGKSLVLAMANPVDYEAIQNIEFASGLSVRPVVASRSEILDGIEERYSTNERLASFLADVPEATDLQILADDNKEVDLDEDESASRHAAEVAPVVKMCNLILYDAIKLGASDIHLEPALNDVQVRLRVDGVLRDYTHVPKWLHGPVVSRMKILAKLDIAERRLPQDGRISVQFQGRNLDLRISTLPTHFGEKVVIRVLGSGALPTFDKMGLSPRQIGLIDDALNQPQGMILVTGPTGSGKSTTLYSMLTKRRSPEVNIVTIEDPIEYQLQGINQVQVNPKAGLTFAGCLRSILRQDPDVILVGEMRDKETCEVAFQASMTGHLVMATLHTNNSLATIARLLDLGVDASQLASSITLIMAQRLARRICSRCREPYTPDSAALERLRIPPTEQFTHGAGCPACGQTGYSGRVGLYEILNPSPALRELIHNRAGELDMRKAAAQAGMRSLRDDALDKVRAGETTVEEIMRVVQLEREEVPCPECGSFIQSDFSTCPYCLHSLRTLCATCGQELKPEWKLCPYCNGATAAAAVASDPLKTHHAPARGAAARSPAQEGPSSHVAPPEPEPRPLRPRAPSFVDDLMPSADDPHRLSVAGSREDDSMAFDPNMIVRFEGPAQTAARRAASRKEEHSAPPAPPSDGLSIREPVIDYGWVTTPEEVRGEKREAREKEEARGERREAREEKEEEVVIQLEVGGPTPEELIALAEKEMARGEEASPAPVQTPIRADAPIPTPASRLSPPASPESPLPAFRPSPLASPEPPIPTPPSLLAPPPESPIPPLASRLSPPASSPAPPAAPPALAPTVMTAPVDNLVAKPKRLHVLIVDDDEDIQKVVRMSIARLPLPIEIETASDGVEALERANARPPDIVILDVMMPRLDGFGVCKQLRQNLRTAFVPILMLTANADETSRSKGYLMGTDDYMGKPFSPPDLNLRITRLLRRTYGI